MTKKVKLVSFDKGYRKHVKEKLEALCKEYSFDHAGWIIGYGTPCKVNHTAEALANAKPGERVKVKKCDCHGKGE